MMRKGRTISADSVKLLIRQGEGLTVEFKERYTPRIDQDIVAFANAKGGAILLGVRDDGTVGGERLTNDVKAKLNTLARNCKPTISVELAQVGKVAAVVVPEGTDKLHIYDRRDVRDDLLTQFNEAVAFLKRHLNIRSEIRGVNREDIYELPLEALREAVVNASCTATTASPARR